MKKSVATLGLAATMLFAAAPNAFANHVDEKSQDTAGAGTKVCRPGPQGHDLIGSWVPYTQEGFIVEVLGIPLADAPDGLMDATWAFCDKNRDGVLCVMATEPSRFSGTLLDNRPFPNRG